MVGHNHRRRKEAPQLDALPSSMAEDDNAPIHNESASNNNESSPTNERKGRGRTKLKKLPNGVRIPIQPNGDQQFDGDEGIGGQLTSLLKHEYPSIIKEKDQAGEETKRHASAWKDYYITKDRNGKIAANRVKEEFWSIYSVDNPIQRVEADCVLENYAKKQFRQMWYQARKGAVKKYHNVILEEPIKDKVACRTELTKNQYMQAQSDWCDDGEVWESICDYWCSSRYKAVRKRGQEARLKSDNIAQNRGGSRSFSETKRFLAKKYGPAAATHMNTYCCMKSGLNKCGESGSSGPINNQKAQIRVDDYYRGL